MDPFDDYRYKRVVKKDGLSALFVGTFHENMGFIAKNDLVEGPKKLGKEIDLVVIESKTAGSEPDDEFEEVFRAYADVHYLEEIRADGGGAEEHVWRAACRTEPRDDGRATLLYNCKLVTETVMAGEVGVESIDRLVEFVKINEKLDEFYPVGGEGGNDFGSLLREGCGSLSDLYSKILVQELSLDEVVSLSRNYRPSKYLSKEANNALLKFQDNFFECFVDEREEEWQAYFSGLKGNKRVLCYTGMGHTKTFVDRLIGAGWEEAGFWEW